MLESSDNLTRFDAVREVLGKHEPTLEALAQAQRITLIPDLFYCDSVTTHVDSVRAALEEMSEFTNKRITIASAPFRNDAPFHGNGYHELLQRYSVRFLNVNHDSFVPIRTGHGTIAVSSAILRSDFRVVLATGALDTHVTIRSPLTTLLLASLSLPGREEHYNASLSLLRHDMLPLLRPKLAILDGLPMGSVVASEKIEEVERATRSLVRRSL